jgi:hypothetical protein
MITEERAKVLIREQGLDADKVDRPIRFKAGDLSHHECGGIIFRYLFGEMITVLDNERVIHYPLSWDVFLSEGPIDHLSPSFRNLTAGI